MHHYRLDSHRIEQHDVLAKGGAQFRREHRMSAVFDYERLAMKALNVRQRLNQNLSPRN